MLLLARITHRSQVHPAMHSLVTGVVQRGRPSLVARRGELVTGAVQPDSPLLVARRGELVTGAVQPDSPLLVARPADAFSLCVAIYTQQIRKVGRVV